MMGQGHRVMIILERVRARHTDGEHTHVLITDEVRIEFGQPSQHGDKLEDGNGNGGGDGDLRQIEEHFRQQFDHFSLHFQCTCGEGCDAFLLACIPTL